MGLAFELADLAVEGSSAGARAARTSHRIVDFTQTPEAERYGLHLALRAPDAGDSPAGTAPRLRVLANGRSGAGSQRCLWWAILGSNQ